MHREIEIIIAGKGEQLAPVTLDIKAIAGAIGEGAAQGGAFQLRELVGSELIEAVQATVSYLDVDKGYSPAG